MNDCGKLKVGLTQNNPLELVLKFVTKKKPTYQKQVSILEDYENQKYESTVYYFLLIGIYTLYGLVGL